MPVMDGWEATREIQKVFGHRVPIVAVTANALKGDREKCLENGMDDYITKPVKLSVLHNVIHKWINIRSRAEEGIEASADGAGGNELSSDVSILRWGSFSIYTTVETSLSLKTRERILKVPHPSMQPVDVVGRLTASCVPHHSVTCRLPAVLVEIALRYFNLSCKQATS